jgi:biopolymer transport protein ExbD
MKIDTGNTNKEPHIDLIPLIDVIFCILTFFLLAGLQVSRQQAIGIDIPKATSGTPSARELLMVTLNDAGQIFLEQQPMVSPIQLVEAVKQYRQAKPNSSIVLYAAKQVSYDKVVEILDVLRGVAGDRVALATLPNDTVAPTPPILNNPTGYGYPNQPYNPYQTAPGAVAPNPYQPAPVTPQVNPAPPQMIPAPINQPTPAAAPSPR